MVLINNYNNVTSLQANSKEYFEHLQDKDRLSSHLQPLLVQFSKMSQSVEKMTSAYQQVTSRIGLLETKCSDLEMKNQTLQKENAGNKKLIKELMMKVEEKEQKSEEVTKSQVGNIVCVTDDRLSTLEQNYGKLFTDVATAKNSMSKTCTHNEAFLWRIPEMKRRIRDAKLGRITSIYSPPFYTGRNGYKMCIRAYLNGDGTGEGTHLSILFVLMRGEYDPLLEWPFEHKVSLIFVDQDQKKHLVQTFKPNIQSSSFQNVVREFAKLSILDNSSYVKDDVMYIKVVVDTSSILHP